MSQDKTASDIHPGVIGFVIGASLAALVAVVWCGRLLEVERRISEAARTHIRDVESESEDRRKTILELVKGSELCVGMATAAADAAELNCRRLTARGGACAPLKLAPPIETSATE